MTEERVEEMYTLARAYCIKKHIWFDDDLIQDLVLHLYNKSNKFDPNKGSFSTFAFMCFKNYLYDHKRYNNVEVIVDVENEVFVSNYEDCYKKLILDEILGVISEDEIMQEWLAGMTAEEIAQKQGKHRTTVSRYIAKQLEDLKEKYIGG